jgi:hypothetical protein
LILLLLGAIALGVGFSACSPLQPASPTPVSTPESASIAGWVYIDENVDNVRQVDEGAISGAMLTLKAGACPGGADITTVESDVTGRYTISPVDPGDYCLATSPIQQTLDPTEQTISVSAGEALDDVNFRYLLGYTGIAGWVYIDENVDNVRQADEGAISGAMLTLKAGACPGGADITTVESDVTGRYTISPVDPGDYCLATSPIQQTLDPTEQTISVSAGEALDDVNFRYLLGYTGIAGWVYIDENVDNVRQADEGSISGAMLTLKAGACPGGADITTVESDTTGRYVIMPVDPGEYCLATSPIQQTLYPTDQSVSIVSGVYLDNVNFRFLLAPLATDTPTPTAMHAPPMATSLQDANCRLGPDPRYDMVGALLKGQTAMIEGRNQQSNWWWILIPNRNVHCWVWGDLVEVSGDVAGLRVIIPPPLPTATPTPIPGCWNYNDKKQLVCVAPCPSNPHPGGACTP